jgi:chromosome segregation ATPase
MKNKLVIWGSNAQEEKVLIALELLSDYSKVMLYTFPEAIATEEFTKKMMDEWRTGSEVEFPEGHTALERPLSVTDGLLPDELKVERTDIISRAQTEWHFVVLSSKLHAAYQQELAELKEKVQTLEAYDSPMWDSLKAFWDKVQGQSRERNLFREHADNLRDETNKLFEDLKKLKSRMQDEFTSASTRIFDEFSNTLETIEANIQAGGTKINRVFDELKDMQRRYREARLSNEHRGKLWDRIDAAFKAAKEKKFGPGANDGTASERADKRLAGLEDVIRRVTDSIRKDEDELNFQRKKVDSSEGQLEAQIRLAKIKMVEERLASKKEKLADLNKVKADVLKQAAQAKAREAKRSEKEQKAESAEPTPEAETESLLDAASTILGDSLMDALDSVKAVATVVAEQAEAVIEDAVDKIEAAAEKIKPKKSKKDAPPPTE